MKIHELKCDSEPFQAILDGSKRFDFRLENPGFNAGDDVLFIEYADGKPTGREAFAHITYVLRAPECGLPKGSAIASLDTVCSR